MVDEELNLVVLMLDEDRQVLPHSFESFAEFPFGRQGLDGEPEFLFGGQRLNGEPEFFFGRQRLDSESECLLCRQGREVGLGR
jgi:hypothetical protein